MDVLCSQWNFGSCPFMILVLLLNSYAVWKSNWYFHINFGQICEHSWQLLKLLKMASPRMEDIPSGIGKTGDLSPPTLKQGWILSTMGGNEPVWCHNIVGGAGVRGWRDEPKAGPKIILSLGAESYVKITWKGSSAVFQFLLISIVAKFCNWGKACQEF